MRIFVMQVMSMLSYERTSEIVLNQDTIFGILEVHEYELFLDNYSVGVMEMSMDDAHVFIFNVYLEEEYRGEGIFTQWLRSLGLIIVCFQPVPEAKNYWERVADEIYP